MIARLVKRCALWFIIIGTISWATAFITGNSVPTFIGTRVIDYGNGITTTLYTLDIHNYLLQVEHNLSIPFIDMVGKFPALPSIGSNILTIVPNMFIWMINVWMWLFNITAIIPIKLLLQPIIFICSILGIDLEKYNIINVVYALYRFKIIAPINYI